MAKTLFGYDAPIMHSKAKPDHAHACAVGTGPKGETCATCRHYFRTQDAARPYLKCLLCRDRWTGGPGTDIKAHDAACQKWQAREAPEGKHE